MAWIEFHAARIKRLKKFRDFRAQMSWSVNEALGCLGNWWGEAIELREDGDVTEWGRDYLAEVCSVSPGSAGKFWDALVSNNWLDKRGERYLIHGWLEYAGPFLKKRYYTSNPARLMQIWALHGETYSLNDTQRKVLAEQGDSAEIVSKQSKDYHPPNLPDLTYQPNQPSVRQVHSPANGNGQRKEQEEHGLSPMAARLARRGELLARCEQKMPFGEKRGVRISDLDPSYCRWLLNDWEGRGKLDATTRGALEARVALKAEEVRR